MQYTFVVTLGEDSPENYHMRVSLLLRKMALAIESGSVVPSENFSQGHNFECIKLTKADPDAR